MDCDVAVVGGGPAGLATAAFATRAGLETLVFERCSGPPDKACGEGLMPAGVRVLDALGVTSRIGSADAAPIVGIRYVQEDGSCTEGRLPGAGGRGIRRTALTAALAACAAESGARMLWSCAVDSFVRSRTGITLATAAGEVNARVLVAADGLHSRMRTLAGLDGPTPSRRRFGLRQHFRVQPWSDWVEVHLRRGLEAFVTPAGSARVGVAFLWEKDGLSGATGVAGLLAQMPVLAARLAGAPVDSRPRGAGPLAQAVRGRTADRIAFVGDAAGYLDAITGEGLSLAFQCAEALGNLLPSALAHDAAVAALAPYERFAARAFRRYEWVCRSLLALARHVRVRRHALSFLGRHPRLFDRLIAGVLA
jgi:flavin-dependent dehydrogenase